MSNIKKVSLTGLNPEQRNAVLHDDGPLMIFAGAGTGKTRVITHRVAHLIGHRGVPASKILAVTFTNKAAREMRDRIGPLVGKDGARGLLVATFHSLCVRILRKDGHHLGLPEHFSIFGDADQKGIIRAILSEHNVETPPDEVRNAISLAKNKLITPADYPEEDAFDVLVKGVYGQYQNALAGMDAVDFDDLLLSVIRLFRAHGHVKVGWQRRFSHILVDEFQDTNAAQYELLRLLWDDQGSIAVVGDDDQSIYAWRGAETDTFRKFSDEFSGCRKVILTQNYRSTGTILSAAAEIIEKVEEREPKRLWSDLGDGHKLKVIQAKDGDDEARKVVEDLNLTRFARNLDLSEFAILIRTNLQSRAFEAALRESHLPYLVVGATGFFDRAEVRDIIAYLRFLCNDADEAALRRIINTPRRGIGAVTLTALSRYAREHGGSLFDAMDVADKIQDIPKGALGGLRAFVDLMAEIKFDFQRGDMNDAMARLLTETGLRAHWNDTADNDKQAQMRQDGADDVARMLGHYIVRAGGGPDPEDTIQADALSDLDGATLTGFLEHLCLLDRMDDEKDAQGKVTIITLHAAKGLEFENVYLVGMEEGFIPHSRSVEEGRELSEERRLAYVGITRAKRRLCLSFAEKRTRYGETTPRTPSRFLDDIPAHLIAAEEEEPEGTNEEMAENFFANMKNMLG